MTRHAFVVPLRDKDLSHTYWHDLVTWLTKKGQQVVLAVNGPDRVDRIADWEFNKNVPWDPDFLYFLDSGDNYNPYKARNRALRYIFSDGWCAPFSYVVLLDADVMPAEDYLGQLHHLIDGTEGELLIAGRTLTKIPMQHTFHFDSLRKGSFECYDGFTPADHTIGANMIVGSKVFEELGEMREDVVSGGDGCYGIDWKNKGHRVTVGSGLIVHKTIYGMDWKGILDKQVRRAMCYPPEMTPDFETVRFKLMEDCAAMSWMLRGDEKMFEAQYHDIVDRLFKLGASLGLMSKYVDKEIP